MVHPRLSVDAMCSFQWPFARELALWKDMGLRHAGLLMNKIADDPDRDLKALGDAGIRVSTLITAGFQLGDPSSWSATRAIHRAMIDLVAAHRGHSIYFTTGRTVSCDWDEDFALFAEAVAPTVAHARERGVIAAFEPSLRTSASFCTTLADAVEIAEATGLGIVSDFSNNWMERGLRGTLKRAMPHIALVQIGDIAISGTGGRSHIGQGDLPLERMMGDVLDAGYEGVFDLEVVPADYTANTNEDELRAGISAASDLLHAMNI
ncbi:MULTISPECIES: sugar phosphate isomerase/epimerase family protein [unclassified Novosphingobium]|uniref:sugar phosphate isomerase/epimerase family protein n=1 Tax=unclassified Novosphingobium TaxID=2644732 RepID=UPI0006C8DD36|nr:MULTISPECIES: TIM barrel protein [unclassified Novosphingobium]MPS69654.1 sugar phosphate isomerase/epimerase [Novosphingobium sp.]TCM33046.1 sugar phosphate isomerase/epimerase [Novosphingobium sp. ST904]WRT94914.1 TIM barrel protein [Novosphingobium sp. RL4]